MEISPELTLREAKYLFYKHYRFPQDGGISKKKWAPIQCRDLKVYLPNFEWRRKAIPYHDLHHIVTNYPLTPSGEFQMAAWEFAAGRYPNICSTLFCIPLVSLGAILIPKKQFKAYIRGRHSKTLYGNKNYEALLEKNVYQIREEILPKNTSATNLYDILAYIRIVLLSGCVTLSPLFLILLTWSSIK